MHANIDSLDRFWQGVDIFFFVTKLYKCGKKKERKNKRIFDEKRQMLNYTIEFDSPSLSTTCGEEKKENV